MNQILKALLGPFVQQRTYGPKSLQGLRHAEVIHVLAEALGSSAAAHGHRFLDVGCGQGQLLLACDKPDRHLEGCDWLERIDAGNRIQYSRVDLNRSGLEIYPDSAFDVILCSDVLEHLENPARILREMSRVMSQSGISVVSIPNSWNLLERIRFLFTSRFRRYRAERDTGPWGHISIFTRDTFQSLCDRANLTVARITGGGKYGHLALAGLVFRTPPSTLLSYNLYMVLVHTKVPKPLSAARVATGNEP